MAAAAVRYLRSDRTRTAAGMPTGPVEALPRPELRCVGADERAPVDQAEFRRVLGNFATGVTVITAPGVPGVPVPVAPTASGAPTVSGALTVPAAPVASSAPAAPVVSGAPVADGSDLGAQLDEHPGEHPDGRPAGFACQSFSSLSLDPPLVAFMVGRTSTTWPRIARAGVFCVNVLGAGQGELCRRFAVSGADKFAGVVHEPAPATGSPRLTGASAWIDCTIHAVHTGGDHLIVVGRVEALGTDGEHGGEGAAPLLFHRGRFGGFTTG